MYKEPFLLFVLPEISFPALTLTYVAFFESEVLTGTSLYMGSISPKDTRRLQGSSCSLSEKGKAIERPAICYFP